MLLTSLPRSRYDLSPFLLHKRPSPSLSLIQPPLTACTLLADPMEGRVMAVRPCFVFSSD